MSLAVPNTRERTSDAQLAVNALALRVLVQHGLQAELEALATRLEAQFVGHCGIGCGSGGGSGGTEGGVCGRL